MNDRRDDDRTDRDPHRDDCGPDGDRERRGGQGGDTRFLQLEMSRVLYAEAEGVTKQAFRELLLEGAKARLRDRFGETITRLAELATDELLADIEASLDVEEQIQRRRESSEGGAPDRLREALGRKRADRGQPSAARKSAAASSARRRRR
jgi:hypothetical protein